MFHTLQVRNSGFKSSVSEGCRKVGVNNIYLVGPMGAGKSSLGLRLANALDWPSYDTDAEVEKRCGVDVSWIYQVEGEAGFRKRESEVIAELVQKQKIVLSTGAGAILAEVNRKHLVANGTVIYLQVSLEKQLERTLHHKSTRPLLYEGGGDLRLRLEKLNQQREHLYRESADLVYQTDVFSSHKLIQKIVSDLKLII